MAARTSALLGGDSGGRVAVVPEKEKEKEEREEKEEEEEKKRETKYIKGWLLRAPSPISCSPAAATSARLFLYPRHFLGKLKKLKKFLDFIFPLVDFHHLFHWNSRTNSIEMLNFIQR